MTDVAIFATAIFFLVIAGSVLQSYRRGVFGTLLDSLLALLFVIIGIYLLHGGLYGF